MKDGIAKARSVMSKSAASLRRARWLYATQIVRRAIRMCLTDASRERILWKAADRALECGMYAKATGKRITQLSILSKMCAYETGHKGGFKWHHWCRDEGWSWGHQYNGMIHSVKFQTKTKTG